MTSRQPRPTVGRIVRVLSLYALFAWPCTVDLARATNDAGFALQFFGSNVDNVDKVFIRIDAPAVPADVGATDFTIEFWMKANLADNPNPAITPGQNFNWINGNIMFDRDIFGSPDFGDFGVALGNGIVAFGVETATGPGPRTIVALTNVCNGLWHHVAVQRRRSDGRIWIFVDGVNEAEGDGPDGDASYRNGRSSTSPNDPYLVIGGEKHGFDNLQYRGLIDEVRISNVLRYFANFVRPTSPFVPDAGTIALYHFDEGAGTILRDLSGAVGGPSDGQLRVGGTPPGPAWVISDAPIAGGPRAPLPPTNLRIIQ